MTSVWLKNPLAIPGHGAGGGFVFCGAYGADRVMIGGEWRALDGAPVGGDVERLRFEHLETARVFL